MKAGFAKVSFGDLEKMINLVFSWFSFILHLAHHTSSESSSSCSLCASRVAFSFIVQRSVSSTNWDTEFKSHL